MPDISAIKQNVGKCRCLYLFWDGISKGTKSMFKLAEKRGLMLKNIPDWVNLSGAFFNIDCCMIRIKMMLCNCKFVSV